MNIRDAKSAVSYAYDVNLPIMLLSAPGIGKSSIIYQLAREKFCKSPEDDPKKHVIEIRTSTADASEIADLKVVHDGKVINAQQAWVPTVEAIAEGKFPERGMILLDEMLDGPMMVQSVMQQFSLDRRLGTAELAPGWFPVAASNQRKDGAAAGRLSTALASRYIIIEVEHDLECTIAYAFQKNWNPMVPAFLRFRPGLLTTFEQAKKQGENSFACGRTWEMLSKLMSANIDPKLRPEMYAGVVGRGVAAEVLAFERVHDSLPDMDVIRNSPKIADIPSEPSVLYATIGVLISDINKKKFEQLWPWFSRLSAEFCTVAVKDIVSKLGQEVITTKAWSEFVTKYGSYTY